MSKKGFTDKVQINTKNRMDDLIPAKKDATYIAKDDEGIKQQARDTTEEIKRAAAELKASGKLAKRGRPKRIDKNNETAPASERGTIPGETRKTYIVNMTLAEKLEAIAKYKYLTTKEALMEAMRDYVNKYEDENGTVKPLPPKY